MSMRRLVLIPALFAVACGDSEALPGPDTNDVQDSVAADTTVPEDIAEDSSSDVRDTSSDTAETSPVDTTTADTAPADTTPDTSPLGGDRPARVVVPADYRPDVDHPLVILLHGYSATGQLQDLYLDFSPRAAARGFIVIVPEGRVNGLGNQYWNASPGWCCDFTNSGVDDAGYLLALVAEAKTRYRIDARKVFLVGHSNGGFMSYKMACEHADVFAGMVSIAGSMPLADKDCAPSEPVAVLQVHGTLDAVIAYNGTAGQYPSAPTVVDRWVAHNGCETLARPGEDKDYDNGIFGAETSVLEFPGCTAGAAELWRLNGSSHVPAFTPAFVPAALDWLLAHPKAP